MTPKEKAEELWMKMFQKQIEITGNGDGNLCVEMALISVDEILKSNPCSEGSDRGGNFIWVDDTYYWQQVKQEIENL